MTQKIDYITECKNYLDIMLTKHGYKAFSNKDFIKIAFEYEYSSDFWRELAIKHGEPLINWTLENFNYFPYDDNENFTEFFIKSKIFLSKNINYPSFIGKLVYLFPVAS